MTWPTSSRPSRPTRRWAVTRAPTGMLRDPSLISHSESRIARRRRHGCIRLLDDRQRIQRNRRSRSTGNRSLAKDRHHLQGRQRGFASLVGLVGQRAFECLLDVFDGEHAKHDGHPRAELHVLDPSSALPRHNFVVTGFTADDCAQREHRVEGAVGVGVGQRQQMAISNAPGTQPIEISDRSTPASANVSSALTSSREVMAPLNRAQATPMRKPAAVVGSL
jgi:hypothetical protein